MYPTYNDADKANLPDRMNAHAREKILTSFEANFGGKYSKEDMEFWREYLVGESPEIVFRAADHINQSQVGTRTWIPKLGEFKRLVLCIREEDSRAQNHLKGLDLCTICNGTQWVKEPLDNYGRPCERCLPESYIRWRDGKYAPLAYQDEAELTGPTQNYSRPIAPDMRMTAPPTDSFRTRQWQEFITEGSEYESIQEFREANIDD